MIDFDDINGWAPDLAVALRPHVPSYVSSKLAAASMEFIEDSRELLFDLTSRQTVVDATIDWISSSTIAGYHGTRLTDAEVASIRAQGLTPLEVQERRNRLIRALSSHPDWKQASRQLDAVLKAHGQGGVAGNRENQVHLTLSKYGLTHQFHHYLSHGAEFDQRVAYALLGREGKELLARDGQPRLVQVAVPGFEALKAAHPYFSPEDLIAKGDTPNIVNEFLSAWSFYLSNPGLEPRSLWVDCGMVFRSTVPAAWIKYIETLADRS